MQEKTAIKTFENVLSGAERSYDKFWVGENGRINSALIIRYIIEKKYNIKQKDILPTLTRNFLKGLKLGGMLYMVHGDSLTDCLLNAYPNFIPHCRHCNQPFPFKSIKNFYCSDRCKEQWKYENKIKEKRIKNESKRMCIYCGLYKAKPGTKYCARCADGFKKSRTQGEKEGNESQKTS